MKGNILKKFVTGAVAIAATAGSLLVSAGSAGAAPVYFGAISVSPSTGNIGTSLDYSSMGQARSNSQSTCGPSDCKTLASWSNGCGAVAYSRSARQYTGGAAANVRAARSAAVAANRGNDATIVKWACTSNHQV
ncbi:DUF4189 domain-containing protein [Nocardia yamanashiensis]|uniref:DUF4189 domain-containing protein n=1 Tax=Nocardia yamanashiensis TaxID=209247 RepID=UPI001E3173FB|nr:DUF4189 domain-containing protein [Nocardia yamanashiensis]UGT42303.1 DUF4189 domain-containing protein [Nocardia yamanashiensis]